MCIADEQRSTGYELTDAHSCIHTGAAQLHPCLCVAMTQVQHGIHASILHSARGKQSLLHGRLARKGLTARERSLAKGERSHTIHLAGVRGSPPACSMSLGSTHSTAVKGRSSTLTRTGRVVPPICMIINNNDNSNNSNNNNNDNVNVCLASRDQVRAMQVSYLCVAPNLHHNSRPGEWQAGSQ